MSGSKEMFLRDHVRRLPVHSSRTDCIVKSNLFYVELTFVFLYLHT